MKIPDAQYPRFNAMRSAFYHTERKCFFVAVNRGLNFLIVVLGASIMRKVADVPHIEGVWLEFGIVVCITLQMVFDFCGQASLHAYLQKRCYELLAEIEAQPPADEGQISRWTAMLVGLCAEEPRQMRALDAICFNRTVDALVLDAAQRRSYQLQVSCLQRLLRHIVPFHHRIFGKVKWSNPAVARWCLSLSTSWRAPCEACIEFEERTGPCSVLYGQHACPSRRSAARRRYGE